MGPETLGPTTNHLRLDKMPQGVPFHSQLYEHSVVEYVNQVPNSHFC